MAVLQSSMDESKSQKRPPKNKKSTLLLAQDLSYAKNLAANEENVRKRSLKYLKKYLEQRSKANLLMEENLKVLWKGLFYSMWMSDKPLIQEECAENISHLMHCLQFDEAMNFFKIGLVTLQNEWFGIDQLRMNKFLMFVRRLLRQALFVLKKVNFRKQPNEAFAKILEETILTTTNTVPLGLLMHFTEIYLEELAKVSDGKLQPSRTIDFLKPFITRLAFTDDNRIIQWIIKFVFTHLMKQHKLGLEYDDKYKIWRAHGFVGSINQIQKVIVPDAEPEEPQLENESSISTANKPLDPRAGKVNVELPQILFNAKEISEALVIPKSDSRTSKTTRNQLAIWSEKFLKLYNGIYPLGIKKLESRKRKNAAEVDTNIRKAAKKLIKFEQKLLSRGKKGKKRKRDVIEDDNKELEASKAKKKKHDSQIETSGKTENKEKSIKEKDKLPKQDSVISSHEPNVVDKVKNISRRKKTLELKKTDLKNKLKKKKLKTKKNEQNSSIDEYNFCFERNSGIWYVTPEFGTKTECKKQKIDKSNKSETKNGINNGEYKILNRSKKSVKKLQETKSNGEAEVLSRLRGKSRKSLNNLNSKQPMDVRTSTKPGSPKKVVINTRLNSSQEIDDHILQVMSSPQVPWDSSKKPGKPLLKTPIKASPINPFYKLRRF